MISYVHPREGAESYVVVGAPEELCSHHRD